MDHRAGEGDSEKPALSGLLMVDKPVGPTSHDIVASTRKAARMRKVGHAGTLDPFASGLLLVCLGAATRLMQYLAPLPKTYEAVARLGVTTTTDDPEGEEVGVRPLTGVTTGGVLEAMQELSGPQLQMPPRYSAKKVRGEPAHRRVRRGEAVELAPAPVTIHRLELLGLDLESGDLRFRMSCSTGTYVRSLARDLGEALGVGAHLVALRRTQIGPWGVGSAVSPGELEEASARGGLHEFILPPLDILPHLPLMEVEPDQARALVHGRPIKAGRESSPVEGPVRISLDSHLVAVGEWGDDGELRPRKVFLTHDALDHMGAGRPS